MNHDFNLNVVGGLNAFSDDGINWIYSDKAYNVIINFVAAILKTKNESKNRKIKQLFALNHANFYE